jgi:hypothetical protein
VVDISKETRTNILGAQRRQMIVNLDQTAPDVALEFAHDGVWETST